MSIEKFTPAAPGWRALFAHEPARPDKDEWRDIAGWIQMGHSIHPAVVSPIDGRVCSAVEAGVGFTGAVIDPSVDTEDSDTEDMARRYRARWLRRRPKWEQRAEREGLTRAQAQEKWAPEAGRAVLAAARAHAEAQHPGPDFTDDDECYRRALAGAGLSDRFMAPGIRHAEAEGWIEWDDDGERWILTKKGASK
ncbi:hypothetical protein [Sinomonas sp. R1AF57]|uniref:hypothetical protein n=1 Tax=Sinomonas sp. R1AF57 TaxID=2020377 RepID=UPI000B5E87C8|nr:hypothetical protein [Sinomonas sp. R1AF57]ASN52505.1 hypothetical protein CGQ25_10810 [Sinomonas sp. R1AF57]